MLFKPGTPLYSYEVQREAGGQVVYVNYLGASFVPNLADNPEVMNRTIDLLIDSPDVSRIVFVQQRNYSYSPNQVFMLQEIANLYVFLTKQEKILSPIKLSISGSEYLGHRYNDVAYLLITLKRDPLSCYFELERFLGEEKANLASISLETLKKTCLVFSGSVNSSSLPEDAEIVHQYEIGTEEDKSIITILKREEDTKYFYHLMPPEYSLDENKQNLLNLARNVLIEHQPKAEEFTDPEKTRQVFFNVSRDLLNELSESRGIKLNYNELNKLAKILVRHTIGFGLIEVLLYDTNLQDIVLNAPISINPVYLRHQDYDECSTNIIPSREDADSWAAKFRMISGRPLDEANPILDTDLLLGKIRARVSVIQQPLSPNGLAYAIRRHREDPWTLSLFIKNKMLNSFSAGLLSFLIDGSRTMLIAGTRSSGKTSLLGSLMLEIMPKYRIIVIEDTLELPVDSLRKLKYDILRMKVRSSLLKTTTEIGADEGIRTSLRLGDSCLIVGEVRSLEAQALYEAMRVGALANVVAGTIHGASPYGIFDRVVNDLKVPVTSFKATDCIVIANPVKTPDGMKSMKRVVQLTEVRKHWTIDPETEGGFVDLLKYNVEKDDLEASEELINGDSEIIKSVASGVRGWAGNWDAVYDNIELRGKIKQELVDISEKSKVPEILESKFNALSNNMFHQFSEKVREEIGLPESNRVFPMWQEWLMKEVKTFRI